MKTILNLWNNLKGIQLFYNYKKRRIEDSKERVAHVTLHSNPSNFGRDTSDPGLGKGIKSRLYT